jgi:uncharacterized membrane protein
MRRSAKPFRGLQIPLTSPFLRMNMQTFEDAFAKAEMNSLHKKVAELMKVNENLRAQLDHVKRELIETQKSSLKLIEQMKAATRIQ